MLWEAPLQRILEEQGFICVVVIDGNYKVGDTIDKFCYGQEDDGTPVYTGPLYLKEKSNREEYIFQIAKYNPITLPDRIPYNSFFRGVAE